MTNMEKIQQRLAEEIKTIGLLSSPIVSSDYNKDLLTSGLIDSFGFVQFIMFVENEYTITIRDELQFDERIRTVKGMAEIIERSI